MKALKERGFSLIELSFVFGIISVISFCAYPFFKSLILKAHRIEAIRALSEAQNLLERCYAKNFSYKNCDALHLYLEQNHSKNYLIEISNLDTKNYTLSASAKGSQLADSLCRKFLTTEANQKSAWDSKKKIQFNCWYY